MIAVQKTMLTTNLLLRIATMHVREMEQPGEHGSDEDHEDVEAASTSANVTSRTRCESCDPLPVFKAADGTTLSEPEVSYGKLWRWVPARKLAQDLRFRKGCFND